MENSENTGPVTNGEFGSVLEELLGFLERYQDDGCVTLEDAIIRMHKQDDSLNFLYTEMLPRTTQALHDHNMLSDIGIDELPTGSAWIELRDQIKEHGQAMASNSASVEPASAPEDAGTVNNPAALESIQTLDNHIAPINAATSGNILLSRDSSIPDNATTLKAAEVLNTVDNLENHAVPEDVEILSQSFQLWASDPISFWNGPTIQRPGIAGIMMFHVESERILGVQHRFNCVVAYLFFDRYFQSQYITKGKVIQLLQRSGGSADHEAHFSDLIQTGQRCVQFCQQLQPDMGNVDYGPIFRLDIQDKIWSRRDSHFRKKFKLSLEKFRSQNVGRWSETSGARSAAKAIIEVFITDDDQPP
ncbi:hypothetical protein TrVGV298_006938 [Trichoderma virens]|nr:hypothetical protein TrVGV298_006938 [Trichoderma virens]